MQLKSIECLWGISIDRFVWCKYLFNHKQSKFKKEGRLLKTWDCSSSAGKKVTLTEQNKKNFLCCLKVFVDNYLLKFASL